MQIRRRVKLIVLLSIAVCFIALILSAFYQLNRHRLSSVIQIHSTKDVSICVGMESAQEKDGIAWATLPTSSCDVLCRELLKMPVMKTDSEVPAGGDKYYIVITQNSGEVKRLILYDGRRVTYNGNHYIYALSPIKKPPDRKSVV